MRSIMPVGHCKNCGKALTALTKTDETVILIHVIPNPVCKGAEL
jgi:hypothetical protein